MKTNITKAQISEQTLKLNVTYLGKVNKKKQLFSLHLLV